MYSLVPKSSNTSGTPGQIVADTYSIKWKRVALEVWSYIQIKYILTKPKSKANKFEKYNKNNTIYVFIVKNK